MVNTFDRKVVTPTKKPLQALEKRLWKYSNSPNSLSVGMFILGRKFKGQPLKSFANLDSKFWSAALEPGSVFKSSKLKKNFSQGAVPLIMQTGAHRKLLIWRFEVLWPASKAAKARPHL